MKIKIINSGSDGNAYVITDKSGNQLLVECGVKIEYILRNINLDKINGCIISHEHNDHNLSKNKLKKYSINVYDISNVTCGEMFSIKNFKILPIECKHNIQCFGYIIYLVNENKKILFMTDTFAIDKRIPDIEYDISLLECNYSEQYADKHYEGFYNHMSVENLIKWLKTRHNKPKIICLIHLSTRNNLGEYDLNNAFKQYCSKLYIANKGLEIEL